MTDSFGQTVLCAPNASELIMRIQLVRVDIYRPLKTLAGLIQLAPLLMNQAQIVMRRRIARIDRGGFQVLFESRTPALSVDDAAEVTPPQEKKHQQQKRRGQDPREKKTPDLRSHEHDRR